MLKPPKEFGGKYARSQAGRSAATKRIMLNNKLLFSDLTVVKGTQNRITQIVELTK